MRIVAHDDGSVKLLGLNDSEIKLLDFGMVLSKERWNQIREFCYEQEQRALLSDAVDELYDYLSSDPSQVFKAQALQEHKQEIIEKHYKEADSMRDHILWLAAQDGHFMMDQLWPNIDGDLQRWEAENE